MEAYQLKFKWEGFIYNRITRIHPSVKRTISLKDLFSDFVYSIVFDLPEAEEIIKKAIAQSNYRFM